MHTVAKFVAMTTVVALSIGSSVTLAQDRAAVVPGMKILLENDCVRVQYHDVAVGQTVPMHPHTHWNEATVHSIENIGDSDVHNLVIELKPAAGCH